ncbi:hypothetical protein [Candidatus Ichthyocystis sparus]|nr:hypothetical protein [Candidatus Ichthyocystis sparus]
MSKIVVYGRYERGHRRRRCCCARPRYCGTLSVVIEYEKEDDQED